MNELLSLLSQIESRRIENITKIYFSRKSGSSTKKYITHKPSASNEVQYSIIDTIFPYIKRQLNSNSLVEYNPMGSLDGELEYIPILNIPMFEEFLDSIKSDNLNLEMTSLRIDKIGFYCIEITYNDEQLYIFRQFQKLKKLRQGLLTRIVHDELNTIESDFLGIDEFVDMVAYKDKLYLLNHISLERIFDYKDEYLKKTNEALGEILSKNVISNIEQFAEDCKNDVRIMKRFTNIMTKERLPLFFDNYERVPEIVTELEIDIDFDENGKMIYRERSQLFHIINLLSDSYFKSLIAHRTGIAKVEEEMQ